MNRPRKHRHIILVSLALLLYWSMTSAPAAAQTRIRLATLLPQGSSQYQVLEKMGQDWRTATTGGVALTIYGGGAMGSEEDSVRRMRIGQLQAATLSVAGLSAIDPSVGALQKIPMVYRSLEEEEYVRNKMSAEMESRLEQKGFVVLFWADAGWVQIFSRQPISGPEDIKKTKVFVTADDINEAELIKTLQIQPVPLEWTDVLVSLQTGLVDVIPTTPFLCLAAQYDLAAKHLLQLNYVTLVGATVVTKRAWDALTPSQRDAMRAAALEAGKQMQIRSRAESGQAIEAMKKRGLQVHPVPPELEAQWRKFLEGVYPKIRGTLVPADVFDEIQDLLAAYRAGQKTGR
ncbi:MAG: TRAP transporter substrate-binding protein DctP [Candidatus Acidiferrum sp.]